MPEKELKGWNHLPPLPLQTSPLFQWPPRPVAALKWWLNGWFLISEKLIIAAIALISFHWFQPPLEESQSLSLSWIAPMYLRNLVLMGAVAGLLHLYFYTFTVQGKRLRYDPRPLMKNGRQFTLGGQIRDNVFWTMTSGVFFWTAYEVLMFWAMANGYAPMITWAAHPVWFVALFWLIPIWESFYFYWIHRLLHVPFFFKRVHALHHRNINVGPWSGMSMHPVEHLIFLGSVLIHWVVAAHPVHILYHLQFNVLTAATTHTGFEGLLMKGRNRLSLGTFHHQMHHRYFECNYGSLEVPWDKVFGSFHDGTVEADAVMKERRKQIMADQPG
ncbi:sterol desaturase family protein [Leisingera aquimarina]|uniref:sterol desaturase family protein n=1 Tax=Leisingera aquimarina TaxID=476529 RepID=UPI00048635BD|nr:sterol desaturase family protein [Leisingera aquimarina]